jgi:hypothetical protein
MTKKSGLFIRQFVIGLGFLSGIFTAVGIDPQQEVISLLGRAVLLYYPDPEISYLFVILPAALLFASLAAAYLRGRVPGLVSVLVAYCAGIFVLRSAGKPDLFCLPPLLCRGCLPPTGNCCGK